MFFKRFMNKNQECEESRSKWQRKLHLAQINPEDNFDLSDCSLQCVPKGIYSQCRVFLKERLLLNDNALTEIPDDNNNCLDDLQCLKILNVSKNLITNLPQNITKLTNLTELYLSNNMVTSVPDSFNGLRSLELIDISTNQLKQFPLAFCNILSLKYIDISYNHLITQLPAKICNLRRLEKLSIDGTSIKHPPKRICDEGIEKLFKFFNGDILKDDGLGNHYSDPFPSYSHSADANESTNESNLAVYLAKKDGLKKKLIEFEQRLLDENKLTRMSTTTNIDKRQEILIRLKQDQLKLYEDLKALNLKKSEDKSNITETLNLIETHSGKILDQLSDIRSGKTVTKSEPTSEKSEHPDCLISALEEKMHQLMISKEKTKKFLQSELIKEDESLYQSICNFVDAKNTQSRILSEKIALVQNELYHLTKTEILINRHADYSKPDRVHVEQKMKKINEQRIGLALILKELMEEKILQSNRSDNEAMLLQVLTTDSNTTSSKQSLDDKCLKQFLEELDTSLVKLYAPLVRNGSVTFKQLAEGSDDYLKSLGIDEKHLPIIRKQISICSPNETSLTNDLLSEINKPSAPPIKLWHVIECVICLDDLSKIIFIPCGHVCTCIDCSSAVERCPICRGKISEKILPK